uniref:Uncharacterized protein n=1 Tax=Arundo donax TaxID=35708 RepID=A0A0A8YGK5_ARUDO
MRDLSPSGRIWTY